MRLNLETGLVGSSTAVLFVTGIIDWSTIAQFRAGLSRLTSGLRPDVLVDFTGLLSWSAEAQQVLAAATGEARLHGGRLVMTGLSPIPTWQAGDGDPAGLGRVLERVMRPASSGSGKRAEAAKFTRPWPTALA